MDQRLASLAWSIISTLLACVVLSATGHHHNPPYNSRPIPLPRKIPSAISEVKDVDVGIEDSMRALNLDNQQQILQLNSEVQRFVWCTLVLYCTHMHSRGTIIGHGVSIIMY